MGKCTPYNGHRSWNAWNVALWIGNDESLYRLAMFYLHKYTTVAAAARWMLEDLPAKTPDGANYNYTCVREALQGLKED